MSDGSHPSSFYDLLYVIRSRPSYNSKGDEFSVRLSGWLAAANRPPRLADRDRILTAKLLEIPEGDEEEILRLISTDGVGTQGVVSRVLASAVCIIRSAARNHLWPGFHGSVAVLVDFVSHEELALVHLTAGFLLKAVGMSDQVSSDPTMWLAIALLAGVMMQETGAIAVRQLKVDCSKIALAPALIQILPSDYAKKKWDALCKNNVDINKILLNTELLKSWICE